ncbi:MAG TPA: ATP-binding protein, partial [Actinotalea sp.]|nr:ATP-binding protein [Actinotalea sp.]
MSDPLGTAGLRAAALAAWTAHPPRLREDANAEEDHARGHYRDRVVVELAQNAADAAVRSGRPGRLLLRLTGGPRPVLLAANTGAPLDAAGLASLASLRASAKRDGAAAGHGSTVGRFGVGFAAVRSVADEVAVLSGGAAVHFSLARTAALLAGEPSLAAELARRAGSLPSLRLPFEGPGAAAPDALTEPWDTAVVLQLRDTEAVAQVRAQLEAVDDALLLALPGLQGVRLDLDGTVRDLADVADRWVIVSATGELGADLLATRPVEERERPGWRVTWAVPRAPGATSAAASVGVVHAPTPTDEACTVPALLVATFPLDPSRRHVAPGPVTDMLVGHAGAAWATLLLACRGERAEGRSAPDPLDL